MEAVKRKIGLVIVTVSVTVPTPILTITFTCQSLIRIGLSSRPGFSLWFSIYRIKKMCTL